MAADFIVNKSNFADTRWVEREETPLGDGEARLKIEAFALTANNVTYAAFADFAGYWNFFPAEEDGWGRVPMWGFASVAESRAPGVEPGQRYYGYLPASTDLVVQPTRVNAHGFTDGVVHRQPLPGFYNIYHLTSNDAAYDPDFEAAQMLFRPLYATGWLIDDSLMTRKTPPAHVIVTSASSKTAIAYAHAASKRGGLAVTGLTSPANKAFTENTGFYTTVVAYDDLAALPKTAPAILVDILGNPETRFAAAAALGEALAGNVIVGATDWEAPRRAGGPDQQPGGGGVENEVFFAPGHAETCAKRMGAGAFQEKLNSDLRAFYPIGANLLAVETASGRAAITNTWLATLRGEVSPTSGRILTI